MQAWDEAPIVTIARGGESITLGRDPGDDVIHLNGSTGLGIAPVEWKSTPRTAGSGNVVHGVRYGDREVFLPIYASAPTVGELHEWRERLAGLVAPIEDDPDASLRPLHLPRSYREAAKRLSRSPAPTRLALALALCRAGSGEEPIHARKFGLSAGRLLATTPAAPAGFEDDDSCDADACGPGDCAG